MESTTKQSELLDQISEQLNEEKWTRATIENYTKKNFTQMDDMIDQAAREDILLELQELCINHLKHNPKSIIALYIAGVIALEAEQIESDFIYHVIRLFRENKKWGIVQYLAEKVLEYGEDKFALHTLEACFEYSADLENLYAVWERLVKVDYDNAEIAKKLGEMHEREKNKEEAIFYLKMALKRYTRKSNINLIEDIWMRLASLIPEDIDFFYQIEREIGKKEPEKTAALLLLLVDPFIQKKDYDRAIEILKKVLIDYNPKEKDARQMLVDCLKEKYAKHSHLNDCIKKSAINQSWKNIKDALIIFEKNIAFDVGNYVHHRSWGIGEIVELEGESMIIDFETKKNHTMSLKMALNSLKVLPLEHIWILKRNINDPMHLEQLQDESEEGIRNTLNKYFNSFGHETSMKEIKAELVPEIIPPANWTKWWNKAKKIMKTSPMFGSSPTKKDVYFLREKEVTLEEEALQNFHAVHAFNDKVAIIMDYIKHMSDSDSETFREMVQYFQDILNKSESVDERVLYAYLMLRKFRKEYPQLSIDIHLNPHDILKLEFDFLVEFYTSLSEYDYKKDILTILKKNDEDWVNKFATLLKTKVNRAHNYILEELVLHDELEILQKVFSLILDNIRQDTELYLWAAKNLFINEELASIEINIQKETIVFNLLRMMDITNKDIENKKDIAMNRRILNQIYDFLIKEEAVDKIIPTLDKTTSRRLFILIKSLISLDDISKKNFLDKLKKRFPDIDEIKEDDEIMEAKLHPYLVTRDKYEEKQKELQNILNVEIPKNSRDIGLAQEKGDLRENAEYHAAMEMQKHLHAMAAKLREELSKVKIIDIDHINTEQVNVGTFVKLLNLDNEQTEEYTILGEWESDLDKNIISYKSPLGDSLLGAKANAEVSFSFAGNNRRYKVLAIQRATI